MLRLRRSWVAPPGWPQPPRGFAPAAGWQPHPSWPAPPAGWRFWQVSGLRVAASLLVLAIAAMFWLGTVGDFHMWRQHSALDRRGFTTTATVLSYSYDPGGGDPDGWTTDQVRFLTATATVVVATVGHHAPGPERTTRTLQVTYDPQHPGVVRAAGYDDQTDDPMNAVFGASFAVLLTAMAAFLFGRLLTTASGAAQTESLAES